MQSYIYGMPIGGIGLKGTTAGYVSPRHSFPKGIQTKPFSSRTRFINLAVQTTDSSTHMGNKKPHTEPIRVLSLWFEDARLIFEAENHQFRVHSDILAVMSPVFRDMLLLPQPACPGLVDGCTLVHLKDSAVDITYFFGAIFEKEYV